MAAYRAVGSPKHDNRGETDRETGRGCAVSTEQRRPLTESRATMAAAAGVTLVAALGGAVAAGLTRQARLASGLIAMAAVEAALADGMLVPPLVGDGPASIDGLRPQQLADLAAHVRLPQGDGVYAPDGTLLAQGGGRTDGEGRRPLTLVMLGDSTAVGYGARAAAELPGVLLARGVAAAVGEPVRISTHGLTGAGTTDLSRQIAESLGERPDVVVIVVGGNDIRDKVPPQQSAALLGDGVAALRGQDIPVVVGTCPDFGVIAPIPQPLRALLASWSHRLAWQQERAVQQAGGRAVAIGRLVSPEFAGRPEMFHTDGFHPSGAGYARAVAALLPAVLDVLAEARQPAAAAPNQETADRAS